MGATLSDLLGRSVKWPSIDQLVRIFKLSGNTWNKEWAGKADPAVGCSSVPIRLQSADISQTAGKAPRVKLQFIYQTHTLSPNHRDFSRLVGHV